MIIIDEKYEILNEKYRGRKPKFGLIKDNKKYIFKYGVVNYEIYAELIAEQLGLQAGIEMAHYEYANYNGILGVITDNFIKDDDLLLSSDTLKQYVIEIYKENNIQCDLKDESIENLYKSILIYDSKIDEENLIFELMKRWVFYGLILESDKNETNLAFLKNSNGIKLSPDFDNSSMCQLNKNIKSFVDGLRRGVDIFNYTDSVNNQFHLKSSTKDMNFLQEFEVFADDYPAICNRILMSFNKIDVDLALTNVEAINDITIPYEVSFWVRKVIGTRLEDLNRIYTNVQNKKTL